MFAISSVFLLIIASLCHGAPTTDRQCLPDTIDFATKVENSSVVVYGKAMAKIMNEGSDRTFNVFFQVDCILKGPSTLRQINITNAGRVDGKQYCQEFPVGRGYSIAFLEPLSPNKTDYKTYTPADFVEILDETNSTTQLLARACFLHRLVPRQSLASVSDMCPAIGTDPSCHQATTATVVVTAELFNNTLLRIPSNVATSLSNNTLIIPSNVTTALSNNALIIPGDGGHLTHPIHTPQQEIDIIRGKSGAVQVDTDKHSGAKSITFSSLLMIMALYFCSN